MVRAIVFMIALLSAATATAQSRGDESAGYRGLWVSTPYPSTEIAPGDTVTFDVTVHNAGLPPQRVALSVSEAPQGWQVRLLGAGKPARAAFVDPDDSTTLRLEIETPAEAEKGEYRLAVRAEGQEVGHELPIEIVVGERPPAALELEPEVPILPGTPDSTFTFEVELRNETGEDALVALRADAPPGFQVAFQERFGTQKLTSVPVEAGESKALEVEVRPPDGVEADTYAVTVRAAAGELEASTELGLEVSGQPELSLIAPGGRLSGRAYAGEANPLDLMLENRGSAPARAIELSAFEPQGWEVEFEPQRVDVLAPDESVQVTARVTPPAQAIAGDYMVTLRASGDAGSDESEFRITVRTSTLWGVVGIVVIAVAVLVLALAVMRYGRR